MNCDDAKFYVGLDADDARAVAMREHLRACAKCRAEVDHQNNVRATLGLLRYEQPPAGFSERCISQIMQAVQRQPAVTPAAAWWAALREHTAAAFQPLRLAAAAVLLIGLGLYFLYPPNDGLAPGGAPSAWAQIRIERPVPPAIAPAAVPGAVENVPILLAASNIGSMHMDYGPGNAVPVKFEY